MGEHSSNKNTEKNKTKAKEMKNMTFEENSMKQKKHILENGPFIQRKQQ